MEWRYSVQSVVLFHLYIDVIVVFIYTSLKVYWMALQAYRLLTCKHRRMFLTYRLNCYSSSSYATFAANARCPFLWRDKGENILADLLNHPTLSPLLSFSCTKSLHLRCICRLTEVVVNSSLESIKDVGWLIDQFLQV